jgi:hypothetical protein
LPQPLLHSISWFKRGRWSSLDADAMQAAMSWTNGGRGTWRQVEEVNTMLKVR